MLLHLHLWVFCQLEPAVFSLTSGTRSSERRSSSTFQKSVPNFFIRLGDSIGGSGVQHKHFLPKQTEDLKPRLDSFSLGLLLTWGVFLCRPLPPLSFLVAVSMCSSSISSSSRVAFIGFSVLERQTRPFVGHEWGIAKGTNPLLY